jgi:hypothetical protein
MSDRADNSAPLADDPQQVPFDTGCLGCMFLFLVPVVVLLTIAAFDSTFFAELAESRARRNPLPALAAFDTGGFNVALLLLLAPVVWEVIKIARRFVDMKAVWIEDDTIRFHPSLGHKPLPLAALAGASHDANDMRLVLVLRQASGRRIEVPMVDHAAAEAFVAEVARRLP